MLLNFNFSEETIGYIIDGIMDTKAINELKNLILEKFEVHEKINLYLEDSAIEYFSLNAVMIATLFPVEHYHRFHKIALVTDRRWIRALGILDTLLVNIDIQNFSINDRLDAIAWISREEIL